MHQNATAVYIDFCHVLQVSTCVAGVPGRQPLTSPFYLFVQGITQMKVFIEYQPLAETILTLPKVLE
jgi:hypothetical protein